MEVSFEKAYAIISRELRQNVLRQIDLHLVQWVKRKWTKKGRYFKRAKHWLGKTAFHRPKLFVHWQFGIRFPTG
ncbi:MAG: hypothetical protein OEZ05_15600 [Nitrospirota bacterium]|nr:hypothetical protein [Nitrospirota bacterium]